MARPRRSNSSNWGGPRAALAAILAGAAALRLVGIQYGLPYGSLLNPDEQNVVPRAWRMTHGGGLDPHFFDWPTLVMYAVAPFQAWHAAPSYLAGRFVIVAFALGGVAAAWWLGSAAYGVVAGAVAAAVTAVETTHVAFSHAAVTDVPMTTLVTLALALLVTGRLEWAGVAIGLAAAAKYPGALALVPLVVVGWRRWRRLAVSAALAASRVLRRVAVRPARRGRHVVRACDGYQREHREGWLGFEHDHWSGIAFAGKLWSGLGPVLLIALLGLVLALAQRSRRGDLVLGSFVVGYYLSLLPLHSHFPRYVLPLVPPLGALAGRMRSLAPVTLLLLVVPLTWSIRDDIQRTRTDTRIVAARWIEAHVPKGSIIAAESSTAVPPGYRVVQIPLPFPGHDERVDVGPARWVLVSGAVADRVRAASDVYPKRNAFYTRPPASPCRLQHGRARRHRGPLGGGVPAVTRAAVVRRRARPGGARERCRPDSRRSAGRPPRLRPALLRARRDAAAPHRLRPADGGHRAHGDAPDDAGDQVDAEGRAASAPDASASDTSPVTTRAPPAGGAPHAAQHNARLAARHPHVVGVIGTLDSGCARAELPALGRGGLMLVSPLNTADDLTAGRAAVARLSATDSAQAAAAARYIRGTGARRVAALSDGTPRGDVFRAAFARAAARVGLRLVRGPADAAYVGGVLGGPTRKTVEAARRLARRRPARALVRLRPGRAAGRHRRSGGRGRVPLRCRRSRRAARRAGARFRSPLRRVDRQVAAPLRGVRGAGGAAPPRRRRGVRRLEDGSGPRGAARA